jgi:hypothetical protein
MSWADRVENRGTTSLIGAATRLGVPLARARLRGSLWATVAGPRQAPSTIRGSSCLTVARLVREQPGCPNVGVLLGGVAEPPGALP